MNTFYVVEIYYTGAGWCQNWDTVTSDTGVAANWYRNQCEEHPDKLVRVAKFARTVAGVPKRSTHVKQ